MTLPNHIKYLHPNIEDVTIPFFTINNISISVKRSNFTFVNFKVAYHPNTGTERNFAGSRPCISRHIFRKFLNTSANNNVSL